MKHNKVYLCLLFAAIFVAICVSGCMEIDSDGDGYNDKIDAFPNDAQYNHDYDGDGYADEIDDFQKDPEYHLICSECKGLGTVTSIDETQEPCIGADMIDAYFEDGYSYLVLENNDPVVLQGGEFRAWVTIAGRTFSQTAYIEPGDTHKFEFYHEGRDYRNLVTRIDGDGYGYENARNPLYRQELTKECPVCGGTGKI
ncbi:hypothetical protein [Methanolobus sp.]|uniref:hypothetical protein n=1 Tax=Methanolobus sp. TaxID=1874737 RepID=UPI0025D95013|nr:hypothetical protein [Methanolobus sp.]